MGFFGFFYLKTICYFSRRLEDTFVPRNEVKENLKNLQDCYRSEASILSMCRP